jgi:hypothetical protein
MEQTGRGRARAVAASWELAAAALMALLGALVLDKTGPAGGEFFVGILFGLGVGLGVFSVAAWRRERAC